MEFITPKPGLPEMLTRFLKDKKKRAVIINKKSYERINIPGKVNP